MFDKNGKSYIRIENGKGKIENQSIMMNAKCKKNQKVQRRFLIAETP